LLFFVGKRLISTGLQVAIPSKYYGRIAPRSGLALNHFIDVGAGVIDADYRGELKVLLFNFGEHDFEVFDKNILIIFELNYRLILEIELHS
jgi:deoxyuridine 5'-triphosphate nucleotidohydrolase